MCLNNFKFICLEIIILIIFIINKKYFKLCLIVFNKKGKNKIINSRIINFVIIWKIFF